MSGLTVGSLIGLIGPLAVYSWGLIGPPIVYRGLIGPPVEYSREIRGLIGPPTVYN